MTKKEILTALAQDYKLAHTVYTSMEKQAAAALEKGDMTGYESLTKRAGCRAFTLHGIKRAALTLGITEADFMNAVNS